MKIFRITIKCVFKPILIFFKDPLDYSTSELKSIWTSPHKSSAFNRSDDVFYDFNDDIEMDNFELENMRSSVAVSNRNIDRTVTDFQSNEKPNEFIVKVDVHHPMNWEPPTTVHELDMEKECDVARSLSDKILPRKVMETKWYNDENEIYIFDGFWF